MEQLTINVKPRATRGKKNRALRKNKWVPAVVYGGGHKNISFALDIRDAEKYSKREYENKIFTFKSENSDLDGLKVIKKETAYHIVKRSPIHMDFLSLDMKASIRISVEVRFKGKPKGLQEGGIFNINLRNLEIECLPQNIPSFIEVDVSHLNINENLHVSDVKVPENIKLITPPSRTLCTVSEVVEETPASEEAPSVASTAGDSVTDKEKEDKKEVGKKTV